MSSDSDEELGAVPYQKEKEELAAALASKKMKKASVLDTEVGKGLTFIEKSSVGEPACAQYVMAVRGFLAYLHCCTLRLVTDMNVDHALVSFWQTCYERGRQPHEGDKLLAVLCFFFQSLAVLETGSCRERIEP